MRSQGAALGLAIAAGLIALVPSASGDEAVIAVDATPQRYHLTLVDRSGVGHRASGEWDRSTSLSIAWHAAIEPQPLMVGLRLQGAERREGRLRCEEGALLFEVGALVPVSPRWSCSAFASYGSGLALVRSEDLAPELRHRLATTTTVRAVVEATYRCSDRIAVGIDGGYAIEYLSDRWTRGGFTGRESGPVLAAVVGLRF